MEQFEYGGRRVTVIRSARKTIRMEAGENGTILVTAPQSVTIGQIRDALSARWQRVEAVLQRAQAAQEEPIDPAALEKLAEEALKILPDKARRFADRMGVGYRHITIRNQTIRWGSCSAQGNLNFNCLLMLTPEYVQDYVVVHELAHRRHMNHSKEFWAEVGKYCPDYKNCRKKLKEYRIG